ncbi:MAG: hypothetical protein HRU78_14460 [Gammaproteobacteria bacterium]|nr:MAG: hypothetical protein HRU78_14460 [Gammaproteobacteria bacterium]
MNIKSIFSNNVLLSLLVSLCATSALASESRLPASKNPPSYMGLGFSELASAPCNVNPPSFGGCDTDCQIMNGMRSAVMSGIGIIPEIGKGFSSFIGFFWGADAGPTVNDKLNQLVKYVQDAIAQSRSDTLASLVANQYQTLGEETYILDGYIKSGGGDRSALLENLLGNCIQIKYAMQNPGITPLQVLPYISAAGNICLTLLKRQAYNYQDITGVTPNPETVALYKEELNSAVKQFSALASSAEAAAVKWRVDNAITQSTTYGGYPCGFTCNHHYGQVSDGRCTEVGAIVGGIVQYDDICCEYPSPAGMTAIREWYSAQQQKILNDNLIGRWGLNSATLWSYMTADKIDAKSKPSIVYATAVSPFMSMGKLSLEQYSYSNNAEELEAFTAAAIADGDSVRLLKLEVTKGDQIIGVRTTTQIAGKSYTNTVGRWGSDTVWQTIDFTNRADTLMTGWDYSHACVQTQKIVNPQTGEISAPSNECKSGNSALAMFLAPPISIDATFPYDKEKNPNNPTFVPRIIGISGLWSNHSLQYITPVWLYKKYQ